MSRAAAREADASDAGSERQRLDKWLFFARLIKSREKAAALVKDGYVRVNGVRAEQPAKLVKPGDVLTVSLERRALVIRVLLAGARRGPAQEAQTLYAIEDAAAD